MIGDWLYALTPRDEQQTPLQLCRAYKVVVGQSGALRIQYRAPAGFALLLDGLSYSASPGATQNVASVIARLIDPDATNTALFVFDSQGAAAAGVTVSRTIHLNRVPIDSRHDLIEFSATFNAPTNPNGLAASLIGTLIPVGNLAPARLEPWFTVP